VRIHNRGGAGMTCPHLAGGLGANGWL
jgi:hypothetical protein